MDAFDSDVLIYAATPGHPQGARVYGLLHGADGGACIGSVALLPEVLVKPLRRGLIQEYLELRRLLSHLVLHDVTDAVARAAVDLGTQYRLKTVDAIHLATAVLAGAERFITNNRRDFDKDVTELDVTFPENLPDT